MPSLLPLVPIAALLAAGPVPRPVITEQSSGTTALLQAVHALDARTVWASGHAGTVVRSLDGGTTWQATVVPEQAKMQWRDLHAASADEAWLMAAGNGPMSRIVHTADGGASWQTQWVNADSSAFFDCLALWPDRRGFAFSDAVAGAIPLLQTTDGVTWTERRDRLPAAVQGEGGFAASGTCATTFGARHGWIATGAGAVPRVHRTTDGGARWAAAEVPLLRGGASGATSVAFRDAKHGVVLGGSIDGKATGPRTAVTSDGGARWRTAGEPPFDGAIYGAVYARAAGQWLLVAVGPGGAAWSADDAATWQPLAPGPFWSVGAAPDGTCWLVGPKGRIVKVTWTS